MSPQRILVIDNLPPMPDRNSGGCRLTEILKLLVAGGNAVAFMPHAVMHDQGHYVDAVRDLGVIVSAPEPGNAVELSGFRQTFGEVTFDTVIICFYTLAERYLDTVRALFPGARVIIDTVDLHWVRETRQAETSGDAGKSKKAAMTKRRELTIYADADALWAITDVERDVLLDELPDADVSVVPNVHEVTPLTVPFEERSGLLFVGNFWHPPNVEAVRWFCGEVMPLIEAQLPGVVARIAGRNFPIDLERLASESVEIAGWVPDLRPLLGSSRLSIAPLLHGAGMKGKVGEAMAHGLPVVTTSIGAEGIGLVNETHALIADSPDEFAAAVVRAYTSGILWNTLAANGLRFIADRYTPDRAVTALQSALKEPRRGVRYVGVPDWNDEALVKRVVDAYVRRHQGGGDSVLDLCLVDVEPSRAYELLVRWVIELGHDPSTMPDVALTPVTERELALLPGNSVWVPMRSSYAKPAHLGSVDELATTTV